MRWSPFTSRVLALASAAATRFGDALFPVNCVFCGADETGGAPVCDGCHNDLPWIGPLHDLDGMEAVVAPLEYAFPVDAAIKAMKFRRKLFYAPAFAQLLMAFFDELPDDIDALLPMPLHWFRHATRGFNQAAEIGRPIAKAAGLPIITNIIRQRRTPFQSGLAASQRRRNLAMAFSATGAVQYRHVLIVDDVITTGESCRQLARVVMAAGAEKVSALAVARTLL
ncbi:MAG: ComF family protein [Woeseiaceae bacterium]|jgi:ComF family protein